jgi:hypothetical protein
METNTPCEITLADSSGHTFFSVNPSRFNVCEISPTLAETWCVANNHARKASIVVSPRSATCARIAA